ncbi:MAG: PIN domain-containing protein [Dehalococcoidia bacterium]|nr:PIN domain-containing protein [Dehalococcoidia bacterium]
MAAYFADASYWIALITSTDKFHELAVEYATLLENEEILTTQMVLNEVLNPRSGTNRQGRIAAVEMVDRILEDPRVVVIPQTAGQFEEAFNLLRNRADDKEWSITDCASFLTMWQRGTWNALTNDHHFRQAWFAVLLR